jgi:hypothetical protein
MGRLSATLAASSVLLAGCDGFGALALASDEDGIEFRTDDAQYTLVIEDGVGRVQIPFTYENHAGRTLHVVNCNGAAPPALEKLEGGRWVLAYAPAVPACLSPAIRIPDGHTYRDTVYVEAAVPASRHRQSFEVDDIEGTYRLVWSGVLYDFDPEHYPFGEEVEPELRRSAEFFIDDPRI